MRYPIYRDSPKGLRKTSTKELSMVQITVSNRYHRFLPFRYVGYRVRKVLSWIGVVAVVGGAGYLYAIHATGTMAQ